MIYKILRAEEWRDLRETGATDGAPIDVSDGFIHFSTADQVAETAARHFAGETGLQLLAYRADALEWLEWEPSRGGALFPHLYAPLRLDQMRWHAPLPLVDGVHQLPKAMAWDDTFVDPERSQFNAFKDLPRDAEIHMLNLVRLRAFADYPDGHPMGGISGQEAYAQYGKQTAKVFQRVGGTILWRGTYEGTLIGPAPEVWDVVFIARYPSAAAFLDMVTDATYREAVVHRQAAVETSRLIRCGAAEPGPTFG